MKLKMLPIICLFVFTACGPSKQEKLNALHSLSNNYLEEYGDLTKQRRYDSSERDLEIIKRKEWLSLQMDSLNKEIEKLNH